MPGIIVVLISFVVAVAGLLQSNAASAQERAIWGLSRVGFGLLVISILGMAAGVWKEIADSRSGAEAMKWRDQTTKDLREISAVLRGVQVTIGDPAVATRVQGLVDRLSLVASRSQESDFSMSDFTYSNFRHGNFTGASFEGALFRQADLRGADLSTAHIDAATRLPEMR